MANPDRHRRARRSAGLGRSRTELRCGCAGSWGLAPVLDGLLTPRDGVADQQFQGQVRVDPALFDRQVGLQQAVVAPGDVPL